MKKLICIFLVILFTFSLSGCGTNEEDMLLENTLYNSNYGDSPETVKKNAKNLKFIEEENNTFYCDKILHFEGKFFNIDSEFTYFFNDDKLEELEIHSNDEEMKNNYKIALEKYNKIIDEFTKSYGDTVELYSPPTEGNLYWLNNKTEIWSTFAVDDNNKNASMIITFSKHNE